MTTLLWELKKKTYLTTDLTDSSSTLELHPKQAEPTEQDETFP